MAPRGQNRGGAEFTQQQGQEGHDRSADEKIDGGMICQSKEPDKVGVQPEKERRHIHGTDH